MILKREWFGNISEGMASRIAFLTVGIWWVGFAQIPFSRLPDGAKKAVDRVERDPGGNYLLNGFKETAPCVG